MIAFCKAEKIDFVVVGPEGPLVAGIVDDLAASGIKAFGPSKLAAQLEGSKGFTKDFCAEFGLPTGAYKRFTAATPAKAYVAERNQLPIVIKADGLAAGKGVVIAMTRAEAVNDDPAFLDLISDVVLRTWKRYERGTPLPLASAAKPERAEGPPPSRRPG